MQAALCPGSFDPVTHGHLDVIARAAALFERLHVTVFVQRDKSPLFTPSERVAMLRDVTADLPNVVVDSSDGLLVDYARAHGIAVVVRGLRAVSDFEYEMAMAEMNKQLYGDLETLFMMTRPANSYLSSTLVREVASRGGDVGQLVPAAVAARLRQKFGRQCE